jgi:hypothetical protein
VFAPIFSSTVVVQSGAPSLASHAIGPCARHFEADLAFAFLHARPTPAALPRAHPRPSLASQAGAYAFPATLLPPSAALCKASSVVLRWLKCHLGEVPRLSVSLTWQCRPRNTQARAWLLSTHPTSCSCVSALLPLCRFGRFFFVVGATMISMK